MDRADLVLELMKAFTRGGYRILETTHQALSDDGRIDIREGFRIGRAGVAFAEALEQAVSQMVQDGIAIGEVVEGLRRVYTKLNADDAKDVFGLA